MNESPNIVRWEEAMSLLANEKDVVARQLMGRFLQVVLRLNQDPNTAHRGLDLYFAFSVVKELSHQQEALTRILAGEDISEDW